jgi:hypothetical protein
MKRIIINICKHFVSSFGKIRENSSFYGAFHSKFAKNSAFFGTHIDHYFLVLLSIFANFDRNAQKNILYVLQKGKT